MFYIEYHSPTAATISFQTNCYSYTILSEARINCADSNKLQKRLEREKAMWLVRVVEEFSRSASKSLALQRDGQKLTWPDGAKRPKLSASIEDQTIQWRNKWRQRLVLHSLIGKWLKSSARLTTILADIQRHKAIFKDLVPSSANFLAENTEKLATEILNWVENEMEQNQLLQQKAS